MLHLIIKRVVKLLALLVIISSLIFYANPSYSQAKDKFSDSVLLKKAIDSVLAKYGLKSKGFSINVISINQRGGQTAYTITNNYYRDSAYIPDSINFTFSIDTYKGNSYLYVSPKYGSWVEPFFGYDSTKGYPSLPYGLTYQLTPKMLVLGGKSYTMIGNILGRSCSINSPLFIYLDNDKNGVFVFGDNSSNNKVYVYKNGKVYWIPLSQK